MTYNRLKLDWTLETATERRDFLDTYLTTSTFTTKPPTPDELELMGNYMLWGRTFSGSDQSVGSDLDLPSQWNKNRSIESIEELSERLDFNESTLRPLTDTTPQTLFKRNTFNRSEARALNFSNPLLLETLENLWTSIDELDAKIGLYEVRTGKKNELRPDLTAKFTEERLAQLKASADKLNNFTYLKLRHELVELRQLQFVYKDFFKPRLQQVNNFSKSTLKPDFEPKVYPFGTKGRLDFTHSLFTYPVDPAAFTEDDLIRLNSLYWGELEARTHALDVKPPNSFDFRNLEDVYQLFQLYVDLRDRELRLREVDFTDSFISELFDTLDFYLELADLSEVQLRVLQLKVNRVGNEKIREIVNKEFGKSYTVNYISTIYRQKIIKQINEAARFHEEIVGNLWFPENFRKCSCCGEILLLNSRNFVKKSKSKTGFNSRCKRCDRKKRKIKGGLLD